MKTLFQYCYFFFYNTIHWGLPLAFFTLYHDVRCARKYGIHTFFPASLNGLSISNADISKSSPYEASNYLLLEKLFRAFREHSNSVSLVDLGCGKGRAMVVAAHFGFRKITGIDFAEELCREATANMVKTNMQFPDLQWRVINGNVVDYAISEEDSVFFLFNPFNEEVLVSFLEKLDCSLRQNARTTWFIYVSPLHVQALLNRGYEVVFSYAIMNLKAKILVKQREG